MQKCWGNHLTRKSCGLRTIYVYYVMTMAMVVAIAVAIGFVNLSSSIAAKGYEQQMIQNHNMQQPTKFRVLLRLKEVVGQYQASKGHVTAENQSHDYINRYKI